MIELMPAVKDARSEALRAAIDQGTGTAGILLYSGARPSVTGDPATGVVLVVVDLPAPCGSVVDGALTLNAPAWVNVLATGTCSWARIVDRNGNPVADMDVGLTGSGADIELNALDVYAGGLLGVTSAVLRE